MKRKAKAAAKPAAKKAAVAKPAAAKKAAKPVSPELIVLQKGVSTDGRRGLMGKMVDAVAKAKKGLTRDELAKRFGKEARVKVVKNVQWGIRHKVFAEKRA